MSETPSAQLEHRTLRTLREAGLIRPRRSARLLATAAVLVTGFVVGILWPRLQPEPEREFILLLRGSAGAASPEAVNERIDEYRRWARSVRAPIRGEKLRSAALVLGTPTDRGDLIGGFFRIEAASLEEAQAIARSCPHLRHGGWIEVREIHKT